MAGGFLFIYTPIQTIVCPLTRSLLHIPASTKPLLPSTNQIPAEATTAPFTLIYTIYAPFNGTPDPFLLFSPKKI